MSIYTIYKIENLVNGKSYIGWTHYKEPKKRFYRHIYSANSGSNHLIHKAIRKHGKDNFKFEILEQSDNLNYIRDSRESFYIKQYNTFYQEGNGYNMTYGGEGQMGKQISDETRKKLRDSHIGQVPWNKGKKRPEMSGAKHPMYGRPGPMLGKKRPDRVKSYRITFSDGKEETIKGFRDFAKKRGYNIGCMNQVIHGKLPKHKDIIKIEKL